jgi:hypothetical protein
MLAIEEMPPSRGNPMALPFFDQINDGPAALCAF